MPPKLHDDFYVGYQPATPERLARFVRRVVVVLVLAGAAVAALAAFDQGPFSSAVFEFGHPRTLRGVVVEAPYPLLRLDREVQADDAPRASRYLLVAVGKHGADEAVRGLGGRRVELRGTLIHRDGDGGATMVEIVPGSLRALDEGSGTGVDVGEELGTRTFRGEIVDSKCYLGVMKPGQGKTHRSCASLCIRGGVPPALRVAGGDPAGPHLLLLADGEGRPLTLRVLDWVAQPVEITGRVTRYGDLWLLTSDPTTFTRLSHRSASLLTEG